MEVYKMRKRRIFTAEFKAEVVLQILTGVSSAAEICRQNDIKPQLFQRWKTTFLKNAASVFKDKLSSDENQQNRIDELERVLGQKTLELEIAKKASSILHSRYKKNGGSR